jgi:hypothetical protein
MGKISDIVEKGTKKFFDILDSQYFALFKEINIEEG